MKTATVMITVVMLSLMSCDIFQTREPEQPSQTTSNRKQPVTPDIVLDNLRTSFAEARADDYILCLTDSISSARQFQFVSSPEVGASHPSLFDTWSLQDERNYFKNLGTPSNGTPFLTFSNQQQLATSSDSVIYNMDYTLFYPHHRAGVPEVVRGNMQVSIGVDNKQQWAIYRWQDFKTTSDSTWSFWKATF